MENLLENIVIIPDDRYGQNGHFGAQVAYNEVVSLLMRIYPSHPNKGDTQSLWKGGKPQYGHNVRFFLGRQVTYFGTCL